MTLEQQAAAPAPTSTTRTVAPPASLRIDGRDADRPVDTTDPDRGVHLATRSHPRLSWEADDDARHAFDVAVHDAAGVVVWASGRVASTETSVAIAAPLQPFQRYRWSVRAQAADGVWSARAAAHFETGPTTIADWRASWVGQPARSRVRTPFLVTSPVERARLYLTGQGLVRAELNGSAVNAGHLDPTRTDTSRALYRCYDLDGLVQDGGNDLDLVLGIGEWGRAELDPRVLAELVIWQRDGTRTHVVPGEDSLVSLSRVTVDDPFYVERHDPESERSATWRSLPTSALLPRDSDAALLPTTIEPDPTPPARVVARLRPTELARQEGVRLYDVGTNISGRSRVIVRGALPQGSVVHVVHGEHVDADGRLDTTNLMMPFDDGRVRQDVEWVATGQDGDVIEAWFAYHGFRYLEILGLPEDTEVEVSAGVLHTDLEASGSIRTDNPVIATLLSRAERTLLNNVHGVPEDCPTREQAAWTGDTASVAEFELAAFDTENFLAKWIRDLVTSQEPDGGLPAIAPDVRTPRLPADPVWGAALHRLLLGHWLHYGDEQLVTDALPALRRWAEFQLACTDEWGVIGRSPISYGHDWLALEQTPPPVHHTAATIDCLLALERLEREVGEADDAEAWRSHADRLRVAAKARFFDPVSGVFANGSQGAYAAAIEAAILTGAEAESAAERIERDARGRGNRLAGGFATTRTIVRALAATGRSQLIADMLEQPAEPGIGAMLASGPGTFWECWWIDPTNTGTGSLDHVGLGGVFAAWAWESLAGVRPTSAGYRSFSVDPQFVSGVDELHLKTRTPVGLLSLDYRIIGTLAETSLVVPEGAVATIGGRSLSGGHHTLRLPVDRGPAIPAEPETELWSAPPIAPTAGDVTGPRHLLARALDDARLTTTADSAFVVLDHLHCMPIPHAQPAGRVAEIVSRVADAAPTARLEFPSPLDATDATFAYALVDLCDERAVRGSRPLIRLVAADGSELEAVGDTWPAGWNRVAVDLDGWAGRTEIVAVEVTVLHPEDGAADPLMPEAAATAEIFHLGEVGLSSARRTW